MDLTCRFDGDQLSLRITRDTEGKASTKEKRIDTVEGVAKAVCELYFNRLLAIIQPFGSYTLAICEFYFSCLSYNSVFCDCHFILSGLIFYGTITHSLRFARLNLFI